MLIKDNERERESASLPYPCKSQKKKVRNSLLTRKAHYRFVLFDCAAEKGVVKLGQVANESERRRGEHKRLAVRGMGHKRSV